MGLILRLFKQHNQPLLVTLDDAIRGRRQEFRNGPSVKALTVRQ